jgi:hypothetical protein
MERRKLLQQPAPSGPSLRTRYHREWLVRAFFLHALSEFSFPVIVGGTFWPGVLLHLGLLRPWISLFSFTIWEEKQHNRAGSTASFQ